MAVVLSIGFRSALGAPNYGLGVVIAVTLACYLYGLGYAVACFVLAIAGLLLVAVESPGSAFLGSPAVEARLLIILITSAVTCALVTLLRRTQSRLSDALGYERRIAQTMQRAFTPGVPGHVDGVLIATAYEPGSEEARIGGDFYDIFTLPDDRLSIAIGDVSGKGIDAARQAVTAKYGLRGYTSVCRTPAECLSLLNQALCADSEMAGFVTLFHAVYDPSERALTYCSGGQELPLMLRSGSSEATELRPNGLLLGTAADAHYGDDTVRLNAGDALLLFTDGLTEAGQGNSRLGSQRLGTILVAALASSDGASVDAALQAVVREVKAFAKDALHDDVTAVLLRVA
jgi:serine phosphatase RsbU (regulator of sigma subunit)